MNCYNNNECQLRRLKIRFKQANQTEANAYLLPRPHELAQKNSDAEFRALLKKAINFVPKVNSVSSSKRMTTDIGLFSSFHWIEPESAPPPPGNLFSP